MHSAAKHPRDHVSMDSVQCREPKINSGAFYHREKPSGVYPPLLLGAIASILTSLIFLNEFILSKISLGISSPSSSSSNIDFCYDSSCTLGMLDYDLKLESILSASSLFSVILTASSFMIALTKPKSPILTVYRSDLDRSILLGFMSLCIKPLLCIQLRPSMIESTMALMCDNSSFLSR